MADERKEEKLKGEITLQSPFLKKLDNFWYHYKWQFLAGLLALVVLIVSLVQCVGKGRGDDVAVMLAGNHKALSATGVSELEGSLALFAEDGNGDGKLSIAIHKYLYFTTEQLNAEYPNTSDRAYMADTSHKEHDLFRQQIQVGEASLCFLSPALFEEVAAQGFLRPLTDYYIPAEGAEGIVCYAGTAYGMRLSSLAIYTYPGFSKLPEDTVMCLRLQTAYGNRGTSNGIYADNMALAKRLLAATPYVQ